MITKIGSNALSQMTTYKMLNVMPIHKDAFQRGLGYEIGLYLVSKYRIYTDGMVSQIESLLDEVKLLPDEKIKVEDWVNRSPISVELTYANLLKFEN